MAERLTTQQEWDGSPALIAVGEWNEVLQRLEALEGFHFPRLQVKYRDQEVRNRLPFKHQMPGDAGYDLGFAPEADFGDRRFADPIMLDPNTYKLVPTGVYVKIPDGYFGLLCGRSSTFGKRGLFVVESRIDAGYTGELFTKVWHPALWGGDFQQHHGRAEIRPWERFAQLLVIPFADPCEVEEVNELPETARGSNGFGSTGK